MKELPGDCTKTSMTPEDRCDEFQFDMEQHVRGLLDGPAREALAAHVTQCATCTKMLELTHALRELGREDAPPRLNIERVLAARAHERRRVWTRLIGVWLVLGIGSFAISPIMQALVTTLTGSAITAYALWRAHRQRHDFEHLAGRLGQLLDGDALRSLFARVVEQAFERRVTRGRKMRVDTTVVETPVR
jgi:hypothetical protein